MEIITGGVTAAKGFKAAAAAAEIKYKGRTDMAMVYSEVPCVAAGTFTTNAVKAVKRYNMFLKRVRARESETLPWLIFSFRSL